MISTGPVTSVLTARGQCGRVVSQLARVLSQPGSLAAWQGGGLGSSDVFNNSCVLLQQWGRWTDSGQREPARSTEERQVLFNFTNCFDIWWLFFNLMKEISLHQTVKVVLVPASFCFGLIFQSVVEPNRENNLTWCKCKLSSTTGWQGYGRDGDHGPVQPLHFSTISYLPLWARPRCSSKWLHTYFGRSCLCFHTCWYQAYSVLIGG